MAQEVNASKARRRWLKWCRYVDKTQTMANFQRHEGSDIHAGQAKAYDNVTYAPRGLRAPWHPRWAAPR